MSPLPAFASAFGGAALSACRGAPAVSRRPARRGGVRMVGGGSGGSGGSIDFSKVDMTAAGETLAGLVFTPEAGDLAGSDTRVRVDFTPAQEAALNKQINVEYTAMYAYHALWAYFDRDVVALPGFAKHFDSESMSERQHASELMAYQNKRGGKVELMPVAVPEMAFTEKDGASDALYAADLALQLEKFVYIKLKELHMTAAEADDPAMCDFVEGYLQHQVGAIKEAADLVAQIKRVGTGHGVYHIDRVLLEA